MLISALKVNEYTVHASKIFLKRHSTTIMYTRPIFLTFSIESDTHDMDVRLQKSIDRNRNTDQPKIITPDFGPDFGGKQNVS